MSDIVTLADGLRLPEGPVVMPDGSLTLSEVGGGVIINVGLDGSRRLVAEVPGMPNGLAYGPDGALYCANMGGLRDPAILGPGYAADYQRLLYRGGSIQRIDVQSGTVADIVTECDGQPLLAPNDLVFDDHGGFYFTDFGMTDPRQRYLDKTGIYYARYDGGTASCVVPEMYATNGIGLSADGQALYWTEYYSGRVYARKIVSPGRLAEFRAPFEDCVYIHPAPVTHFDSLTVTASGSLCIAIHNSLPDGRSGILTLSESGAEVDFVPFDDATTTHVALSQSGEARAYVTLSQTGRLCTLPWREHGLAPRFGPAPAADIP